MAHDARDYLHELLRRFDHALLVGRTGEGRIYARPMAVAHMSPGSDAFFVARIRSDKIGEIEANPDVLVTLQGGGAFATIAGRARVVRDRLLLERYWSKPWAAWFPRGPADPDLCVIAVAAAEGEYWDRAGVKAIPYAFDAAKAHITGERRHLGPDRRAKAKL